MMTEEHEPYDVVPKDGPMAAMPPMKLRDYFAAQALTALVQLWDDPEKADATPAGVSTSDIAEFAYNYADAMMEARLQ